MANNPELRTVSQNEFFSLVDCAEDYGFDNSVLMCALWDFSQPVTLSQIEAYAEGQEDKEGALERLNEWYIKHNKEG